MERKDFITNVVGTSAAIAAALGASAIAATPAAAGTNATQTPYPGFSPAPGRSPLPRPSDGQMRPHHRHGRGGQMDLEHVHLERMIEALERYAQTNGGHLSQAIAYLRQADNEVVAQLSTASPSPTL